MKYKQDTNQMTLKPRYKNTQSFTNAIHSSSNDTTRKRHCAALKQETTFHCLYTHRLLSNLKHHPSKPKKHIKTRNSNCVILKCCVEFTTLWHSKETLTVLFRIFVWIEHLVNNHFKHVFCDRVCDTLPPSSLITHNLQHSFTFQWHETLRECVCALHFTLTARVNHFSGERARSTHNIWTQHLDNIICLICSQDLHSQELRTYK